MCAFERNVFVNCPFDHEYRLLFGPLLFTIYDLGLVPKVAFDRSDAGEVRLQKIREFITESQFSIHDLSRCRASKKGEYFRLNMPLELGIDLGCKWFGGAKLRRKRFLILEKRKWGYQKAVSDLAGVDIKAHRDRTKLLIESVRDWLIQEAGAISKPASEVELRYLRFVAEDFERLQSEGHRQRDIQRRTMREVSEAMRDWTGGQR